MYREHFGLTSKPFDATANGAAVFMSPRQSEQIKALHQGLGAQDAVVTVTGPVGVGKTTFVNKGMELIHPGRLVAAVGRMRMEPEDLFALLLSGFGISRKTRGMIRQLGAFRRYLHERAATGLQVAIVVEDAQRIGIDALIELEALTAADSGATSSANLVLMGLPDLDDLLAKPELARLKQRVRQRMEIAALTGPETQGYLRHCVRHAGGDYDAIFAAGVAEIVLGCSEGIPRLINTLCEEALNAATEDKLTKVTPALMAKIAESTFGYEADLAALPVSTEAAPAMPEPDSDSQVEQVGSLAEKADIGRELQSDKQLHDSTPGAEAATAAPAPKPEIGHDIIVESGRYPEKPATNDTPAEPLTDQPVSLEVPTDEPMPEAAAAEVNIEPQTAAPEQFDANLPAGASDPVADTPEPVKDPVPDLINDTQPELRQLAEPEDHASTLTDIEPIIVAEDHDDDSGDTTTIETIDDPDAVIAATVDTSDSQLELPTLSNSMRVEVAKEPDAANNSAEAVAATDAPIIEDESKPSLDTTETTTDSPALGENEAALAAELEAAYALEQQDLPAPEAAAEVTPQTAPSIEQDTDVPSGDEAAMAAELEQAYALEQQSDAAVDSAVVAEPQTDVTQPADNEAEMAAELEMAYALEQQDAAVVEGAAPDLAETDAPQLADDEAAMAAELEMAYALEQQEFPVTADTALGANADNGDADEGNQTGIFENLDPLPNLDSLTVEGEPQAAIEVPAVPPAKGNNGDVTVTDLAVSAIGEKSRQDIGTLENALESAKQGAADAGQLAGTVPAAESAIDSPATSDIPEITLDKAISDEQPKKTDVDKFAAEIGSANSLEEFSDSMAETLFGSEAFDQIAADVVANPPDDAPGKLEEMDKKSPVKLDDADMPGAANETIEGEVTELSLEETSSQAVVDQKPVVEEKPATIVTTPKPQPPNVPQLSDGGEVPLNESVAMRIDILNKMKNNVAKMAMENVELGESAPPKPAKNSGKPQPESIEDQIDTSITQTLKAVDIARMDAEAAAEEKEKKKSGGLFSRFRKSS